MKRSRLRVLLVFVVAGTAWPPHAAAGRAAPAQTPAPGCEEIAPVLFTPRPATLELSLDAVGGATGAPSPAATTPASAGTVPQRTAGQESQDAGEELPSIFAVSFSSEPACQLPADSDITLAHSVLLSGPADSASVPIVTSSDLTFTEVVSFNGSIEAMGTIAVPGLKPGSWTGTLPLVFSAGQSDESSVLGSATLPVTIRNRQGWSEGFPFSPAVLLVSAIVGGLVVGLYRMLSATEKPDSIALFKPSMRRPVGITWRWRNIAAVVLGIAAGAAAWGGVYIRNPDFAVTWDSSMALFAAIGGATLTAFVAAFAAPTVSSEAVTTARERLLRVDPDHGKENDDVVISGEKVNDKSVVWFGPHSVQPDRRDGGSIAVVKVPQRPPGDNPVPVSVADSKNRHLGEVEFKYD